jgi:hypothetical protein
MLCVEACQKRTTHDDMSETLKPVVQQSATLSTSAPITATALAIATPSAQPCTAARPGDWCTNAAPGPCGTHPNETACRADKACKGLPYKGESAVACKPDGKGFWSNCPATGCIAKVPGNEKPHAQTRAELVAEQLKLLKELGRTENHKVPIDLPPVDLSTKP